MSKSSFDHLYAIIQHRLDDEFLPRGVCACGLQSSCIISTKIRLSIALGYFAGGSIYDIMLVHGVSFQSVYNSVWGVVVDVINNTPELDFHFPSKEQQREIAAGFCAWSGAGFDDVVGAIGGLVICTLMPMNCGQSNFGATARTNMGST
jgi:hypothetical protein